MIQRKMTLQELKEWCKETRVVDYETDSYDDNGNHYETKIYDRDGKLWRLEFCNGHPYERYQEGVGYVRGDYTGPIEVFKKTRTVVETYYETKEEQEEALQFIQSERQLLASKGAASTDSTSG